MTARSRRKKPVDESKALLDQDAADASSTWGRDLYAADAPSLHNSMSFLVAACFAVNYVMGSGFLGLPAVFHDAGLALGPIVLLAFMWLCDGSKDLLLEAMARQEALSRLSDRKIAKARASAELLDLRRRGVPVPDDVLRIALGPVRWRKRDFVVGHSRTFQVNQMASLLWGRTAEIAYMVCVALYRESRAWMGTTTTAVVAHVCVVCSERCSVGLHLCVQRVLRCKRSTPLPPIRPSEPCRVQHV
jgi:hypothetical protein